MEQIKNISDIFWKAFYSFCVLLSLFSLLKTKEMAIKKNYTSSQKKKYMIIWAILLIIFIYFLIDSI